MICDRCGVLLNKYNWIKEWEGEREDQTIYLCDECASWSGG